MVARPKPLNILNILELHSVIENLQLKLQEPVSCRTKRNRREAKETKPLRLFERAYPKGAQEPHLFETSVLVAARVGCY